MPSPNSSEGSRCGLVLMGGGARAAYQVGVLKGIAEQLPRGARSPFAVVTGTSAGAVSAVALAADAMNFRRAVRSIEGVWRDFHVDQVFRADSASMLRSGLHWLAALVTGGTVVQAPHALFDNKPLWELLRRHLDFRHIRRSLKQGGLHAVGISATGYANAESVTYFDSFARIEPWRRAYRRGVRAELSLEHLMASLALPFIFQPVRLADGYYGDGAMRQTSPLGPAFHLGAQRILVIGVGGAGRPLTALPPALREPSYGQMFGFLLDSLFMDHVEADIERIALYNENLDRSHIDTLIFNPSADLTEIARRHSAELPRTLRILMRIIGAKGDAGTQLLSYLMFERGFTRELIALGVRDVRARAAELRAFVVR
ncbi:MAG: patatin-like phospholipase family protein [Gammaproteobacteria bacterium]|nr:patatin-like phospholipase family protein [Gammaproteobacteria bacterium]